VLGEHVQLHDRGRIERGDTIDSRDAERCRSGADVDNNQGRGDVLRLAACELDLKRLGRDKMCRTRKEIHLVDKAFDPAASAFNDALFA
jgi:hypothetical protein